MTYGYEHPRVRLDPENHDDVLRVSESMERFWQISLTLPDIQRVLRDLASPTKPKEPTREFAHLLDHDEKVWVRARTGPRPWVLLWSIGDVDGRETWCAWDEIDVAQVLWEGRP